MRIHLSRSVHFNVNPVESSGICNSKYVLIPHLIFSSMHPFVIHFMFPGFPGKGIPINEASFLLALVLIMNDPIEIYFCDIHDTIPP